MSQSGLDSTENTREPSVQVHYVAEISSESSEEPMQEWSSLGILKTSKIDEEDKENDEELNREELCTQYIRQSDSSIFRHPYYNYPAVSDPGIKEALFEPKPQKPPYPDDGSELYMDLCEECNVYPIHLFYSNLLNSEINLSYFCPNSANIRIMAIALQHNRNVKRLVLTGCYIDTDACYHLGKMLATNVTLEELILDSCRIQEVGLLRLGMDLYLNVSLKTLNLAKNDLNDEGGELFARILEAGSSLSRINLSGNKLGVKTAYALHKALRFTNKITHLDLSWNCFIHIASIVKFLITLSESEVLEELDLSFSGFDNVRIAEAVAEVLLIKTLKKLNLSNNRFSDDSAQILVSTLPESKLKTYNLSNNLFTPTGACSILQIMTRPSVKLKELYMDNICVNRKFMDILGKVRNMKGRKNFVVTFDRVLHDWVAIGDDPRRLILRRGYFMGISKKKAPKDVPMFLLSLSYAANNIRGKEIIVMMKDQKIPVNDDWVDGLIKAFPGPVVDQKPTIDALKMREYIKRIWPDLKLPPDWKPPVMIRVDVKNKKKAAQTSKTTMKKKK